MNVATKKDTPLRETPGIVSVLTRQQILDTGARDVVDVLMRMVPGYSLVTEIEGAHLFGIRGINSIEGKFLVIINGLELNEDKFGIVQFARHFPIHAIERIEVIRGPGSSIYGGYASLGVINIITRNYTRPGSYAMVDLEHGSVKYLGSTVSAGFAQDSEDLKISANLVATRSVLTDAKSQSYYNDLIDFSQSDIELTQVTFDMAYLNSFMKGIVDIYRSPLYYFDEPDVAPWQDIRERWDTYQIELGHHFQVDEKLKLTPFINYKLQYPYWVDQGPYWYRNKVERKMAGFSVNYEQSENFSVTGGYQGYTQNLFRAPDPTPGEELLKGDPAVDRLSYRNDALYLQLVSKNSWANITVGARYDKTDIHGDFFAPRVGLTRVWEDLHVKYMVAKSFRVPGGIIPNRVEDTSKFTIQPETSLNNEIEIGYRFDEKFWSAVNFFDHIIYDPIIYMTGEGGKGQYINGGKMGTRGMELDLRFFTENFYTTLTYSHYRLTVHQVDSILVPGHKEQALGQAQHRAGFIASYKLTEQLSINPSSSFVGGVFTYTRQGMEIGNDPDSNEPLFAPAILDELAPTTLWNVNFRHTDLFSQTGLEASLAIQNLFDTELKIAQPYEASYPVAPIPFSRRSFLARLAYEF